MKGGAEDVHSGQVPTPKQQAQGALQVCTYVAIGSPSAAGLPSAGFPRSCSLSDYDRVKRRSHNVDDRCCSLSGHALLAATCHAPGSKMVDALDTGSER